MPVGGVDGDVPHAVESLRTCGARPYERESESSSAGDDAFASHGALFVSDSRLHFRKSQNTTATPAIAVDIKQRVNGNADKSLVVLWAAVDNRLGVPRGLMAAWRKPHARARRIGHCEHGALHQLAPDRFKGFWKDDDVSASLH